MKRFWMAVTLLLTAGVLGACSNLGFNDSSESTASSGTKTATYQTTGTVDSGMYQGVIKNGRYQTSKTRGLATSTNTQSGTYNIKSMENGLLDLAKKQFSTSKYVFQEGQLITEATAENWLGRKSKDNANGLNPASNGKLDEDTRAPIYLQTLLEQDFMTQSGSKLQLGGIAIALGMNEYDYYQKVKYGATYTTHISDAKLVSEGESMAAEIVARLRRLSGVGKNVPILVTLYKNAGSDALVGGTFFRSVLSTSGSDLGKWSTIDQQNETLPTVNNAKPIDSNVSTDFSDFSEQIENFFPTLAGVTAQAHYEDGSLAGLNISINTQFYSETEIMSFTQYVATTAQKYLPDGAKIEITIASTAGTQALITREAGAKGFYTHVFGSY
ncbi:CamS family sex pheromone protein [Lacticaseibacillus mingshuiensis]|uniref:CamS family sex pheromone protein n=1 Tax=Lacticaseibacillus mingshuiensis TaxID=2799574 RepID=A0ABW4CH80_9LACO|nr:CamS family sex pheromone protein [Lacticaseibacillus mingshuiensis]